VQPMHRDPHRGTYMISHVQPIEVDVQQPPRPTSAYAI
jgi:hypothetical protein